MKEFGVKKRKIKQPLSLSPPPSPPPPSVLPRTFAPSLAHGAGVALTPQISLAYWSIVLSEEKNPLLAAIRMDRFVHSSASR